MSEADGAALIASNPYALKERLERKSRHSQLHVVHVQININAHFKSSRRSLRRNRLDSNRHLRPGRFKPTDQSHSVGNHDESGEAGSRYKSPRRQVATDLQANWQTLVKTEHRSQSEERYLGAGKTKDAMPVRIAACFIAAASIRFGCSRPLIRPTAVPVVE